MNIETIFFYTFSCSTLLVYGIGLEKAFFESRPLSQFIVRIPGLILDSLLSIATLWYLVTRILLPNNLSYLIPMTLMLVCAVVHMIVSVIFPILKKTPSGEMFFFFGIIFLALSEAVSFTDSVLIVLSSMLSFCLTTVVLFAIRSRIAAANVHADWKGSPLILISMGLLCIVLYSPDVSWWLTEVFQ